MNPNAVSVLRATLPSVTSPPATTSLTTARMMSPMTSSITAAPSTTWLSGSCSRPRSESTRAVMPTDVAVSVAPSTRSASGGRPSALARDITQREGHDHAHHRHRERRRAHLQHLLQVGLEPDLEEEDDHADLGERLDDRLVRVDQPEQRRAEQHAGEQFADHRRLAHALEEVAQQLGQREHCRQHQQQ